MSDTPLLLAPETSRAFATGVARALGVSLAPLEERAFEDGEHKARPLVNVRGRDVYVVQSLHGDAGQSVDAKLVRLLFLIATLHDAGADRVTAVVPYLAYARKDRRTKPSDPVTSRYVAQLFEAMRMDRIVTLDVHNIAAYQNAFRCGAEHLEAAPLLARHFVRTLGDEPVCVVSPDAGGVKRADAFRRQLAALLQRPVGAGFAEKYRSEGVVSGDAFVGDVEGATVIIVDDLISGGTTMARTARACRARGARHVHAVATHAVFARTAGAALGGSDLDTVVVTNTVPAPGAGNDGLADKLVSIDVAGLFAEAIRRLHANGSLEGLGER